VKHEGANDGGEVATSQTTADMDPGTAGPYWIEVAIDADSSSLAGSDTMIIYVDGVDEVSASDALDAFGTEIAAFCFGNTGGGTYDQQFDHLLMSTDPNEDFSTYKSTDVYPW